MPPPTEAGPPVGARAAGAFFASFSRPCRFLFAAIFPGVAFFFFAFVAFFFFVAARVAGGRGVVAAQAGEFGQSVRHCEFRALAFLGGGHVGLPDRAGGGAAEAGRFARLRVADPDRG